MPVGLLPLHRHCGEGHSIWGWGAVHCGLIPPPHPDSCLLNKRQIGYEEGLHHGPRSGRPSTTVLLDPRLMDSVFECLIENLPEANTNTTSTKTMYLILSGRSASPKSGYMLHKSL